MKIHEYQGKEILRKFGVTTPRGKPAFSVDEAVKVAEELGGNLRLVRPGRLGGLDLVAELPEVKR